MPYRGYLQMMQGFAEAFGKPVETVAGIFAALSPVNDYRGNLRSLKSILEGVAAGLAEETITVSTTHRNRHNAYAIATGSKPKDFLNGKKVWNFYNNIVNPDSPDYVTIDRHAMSVWLGRRSVDGRVPFYDRVAHDYMLAAKRARMLPNQLQAVTWLAYKRMNRIRFDSHPDLFYSGTNLRTSIRVDEIAAFPAKHPLRRDQVGRSSDNPEENMQQPHFQITA